MVLNDFKTEFKKLLKRSGKTQTDLAHELGMQQPNVTRTFDGKILPDRFVGLLEQMGYDIKVTYVERGDK